MKKSGSLAFAVAVSLTLSFPAFANVIWNDTNGNWNDASKWSSGIMPGATDHAVVNSGFVTIAGSVIVDAFTQTNGQVNGYGNITTNNFNWFQGNINLDGPDYRLNGLLTVNGNATIGLNGSEISLAGNWNASPYACNDCPMTTMILNGNTTLQGKITAGLGRIVNNGTLTFKEGSNTFIDYWNRWWSPLVNNGTLDADAGAGKVARISNLFDNDGTVVVSSGSFLISNYYGALQNKAGSVFQVKSGASVSLEEDYSSLLNNNGGEVVIENGATFIASGFNQTSGKAIFDNANVYIDNEFYGIKITGGEFIARGELNSGVDIHGGQFSLGDTPGALNIIGNLMLRSGSDISFDIAGVVRGINYDAIDASGYIVVSGILNVNFDAFEPVLGSKYTLFSGSVLSDEYGEFGSGYSFDQINVSGLDFTKYSYKLDYSYRDITFTVLAVPEPSSYALLTVGIAVLGFISRRKTQA